MTKVAEKLRWVDRIEIINNSRFNHYTKQYLY